MLADHYRKQAEAAKAAMRRYESNSEMGDYISKLARWCWWATFTFRIRPSRGYALRKVEQYLQELETAAASPIAWVLVGEHGDLNERLHFHVLIAGVDDLSRDHWEREANRRFGDSEISQYDAELAAPYYIAQKAISESPVLEFGGAILRDPSGRSPTGGPT
jgi:hypothetical protein